MIKWRLILLLLFLSGCNSNIDEDSNDRVCAMDHVSLTKSNLAVIFKSQLEGGSWSEVSMSYCNDGAGQLYFNQPDGSVLFQSKKDGITYSSTSLDYQLGVDDWFYVKNITEGFEENPLILEKDENKDIYIVYSSQDENNLLLETNDIEIVKDEYPNLTTNSRVKTAKELDDLYTLYINL